MNITKSRTLQDTIDNTSIEDILKDILIELKLLNAMGQEVSDTHLTKEDIQNAD